MLIEWVAPVECPRESEVVAHVTSLVGEALAAQPLRVWARIVRVEQGRREDASASPPVPPHWRLELRIGDESEAPRVLENMNCRQLADATAFIVALDLQSRAEAAQGERPPLSPPPTDSASPELVTPSDLSSRRPPSASSKRTVRIPLPKRAPRRVQGGLGGDILADVGTLSSLAWAGSVVGFVTYGALRGELSGSLWPQNRAFSRSTPGAGAAIYLRTIGLRACWMPWFFPRLDACLRVEGGIPTAAGFGVPRPALASGAWFAGFAGITARPFVLGPMRVRVAAELGLPLRYSAVRLENVGEVYAPAPVAFRLSLGVETRLF